MKLRDRLTGETITGIPKIIPSGRYFVLEKTLLNNHTQLSEGEIIFPDGTTSCILNKQQYIFEKIDNCNEITSDSVITISEALPNNNQATLSPLLPSALINKVNTLSSLEKLLEKIINKGHLHHISSQPRIDLKYNETVIDVSRARRLSNGTLKHLASHSECWQQRTLTGVIPRKVLARFSEDDYELYENRLYARLLDKLDKHLHSRLKKISTLHDELENALNFQTSDKTHFQLSKKICSLWALTFTDNETESLIETSKALKENIGALIAIIKGLKQRGLYPVISHRHVGGTIHRTNILMHDPHYQQLPPLWDSIHAETVHRKPKEVFEHEKYIHNAYIQYVGLVIRHALKKYSLNSEQTFVWGGEKYTSALDQDEWLITNSNGNSLKLVPWASSTDFTVLSLPSNRVICWYGFNERNILEDNISSQISISPLDLYVVERMGKLIDTWLLEKLVTHYADEISPIPESLLEQLVSFKEIQKTEKGTIKINLPISKSKEVRRIIQESNANQETKNKINKQIYLVEELANCPVCHNKNSHFNSGKTGFIAECSNCNCQWSMDGKTYKQFIKDADRSFEVTGRFFIQFNYRVTSC